MNRVVLDAMPIRANGRGVSRVLRQVFPLLAGSQDGLDAIIVTSQEGRDLLGEVNGEVVVAPIMPKSLWDQAGLPFHARRLGASAIYMHSECAPLWGAQVLLHVPEDPYIRWGTTPVTTWHEHARRAYQRTTMAASIRRAPLVVTSCEAVMSQLRGRFGARLRETAIVPLGVDMRIFHRDDGLPREDMVFHLGSDEPRDESVVVVAAYASALRLAPGLPDLVIAGSLGTYGQQVSREARRLGVADRVRLPGRITDEDLRQSYYHASACLQPARYEGFGLQPLEALACGAPLIVFSEPAVLEVVGDAAVVVTEHKADALGEALAKLWADSSRRTVLRQLGPVRAAQFPWSATADRLRALLTDLG